MTLSATTLSATDLSTPAPDTMEGKTGVAYNASQLITLACHAVANTTFVAPDPKPAWFDDLNLKLQAAIALADEWINTLDTQVSQTIPLKVINFAPTFDATTAQIIQLAKDNPNASGATNPIVVEIKDLISQVLLPAIDESITDIDTVATALEDWGKKLQKAHDGLSSGATNIQSAEIALQGDVSKMNNAISNLHSTIDGENKAIAASAAAIGIGIFALVVGIALAPETGGTSLLIGGAIGAAGIIGGSVTWGVMQDKINKQFDEISKDQQELASDQRQIVALQGLSLASHGAVSNLELAASSLSKLRTQWSVFNGELQGVVDKLEKAEEGLSTVIQGVFTAAARTEWNSASETANALVNRKIEIDTKTLPMDKQQVA